jgi:hypothetical protein
VVFASLIFSAGFLLVVNAIAFSSGGRVGRATFWSLVAVPTLFFCAMSIVLPLNALAVAVAGAVCSAVRARPRWFLASSLVATMAVYGCIALPDLLAWAELKKDYPLESLAERLAYEDRPRTTLARVGPHDESMSGADRLAKLEERFRHPEQPYEAHMRGQSLERLHAGVVRQFIDSPGFGVGRMLRQPRPDHLEQELQKRQVAPPDEGTIPQPEPVYSALGPIPAESRPATEPDLISAHDSATLDFLQPGRFGYVRSRDQVAGFIPHRFNQLPTPPQRWRIARVELVSLLKHETPAVYLSDNLPRMDELRRAPTRLLDEFEKKALDGLLGGEDLMVQKTPRQMRMVGSIRALNQCLRCHGVERGELLGAFSYRLSAE